MKHFLVITKPYLLFLFLCYYTQMLAQNRSENPGSKSINTTPQMTGKTYAVIVGMAKYRYLEELDFTEADARVFYNYLLSLKIEKKNLKLFLDEQRPNSTHIYATLDSLQRVIKPGDKLYFYFAGHGNENASLTLANYNPNSINALDFLAINDLQQRLNQFANMQAQVICVLDACHSGQMDIQTTNNAAGSWKNQLKILSCQPNQKSLEKKDLGGGRGIFSYYFVEGLKGKADKNQNGKVDLRELREYVTEQTKTESEKSQDPQFSGGDQDQSMATIETTLLKIESNHRKLYKATYITAISAAAGAVVIDQYFRFKKNNFEKVKAELFAINNDKTIQSMADYNTYQEAYNDMLVAQNKRWLWWACVGLSASATAYAIQQKLKQRRMNRGISLQPSSQSLGVGLVYTFNAKKTK